MLIRNAMTTARKAVTDCCPGVRVFIELSILALNG
jgi:hypothetical protein